MSFASEVAFHDRLQEASKILDKYPSRVPVICERSATCKTLMASDKRKFLVPKDLTLGQFAYVIRRRIQLPSSAALFLVVNGTVPSLTQPVGALYDRYQSSDAFLYITYTGENTFG